MKIDRLCGEAYELTLRVVTFLAVRAFFANEVIICAPYLTNLRVFNLSLAQFGVFVREAHDDRAQGEKIVVQFADTTF